MPFRLLVLVAVLLFSGGITQAMIFLLPTNKETCFMHYVDSAPAELIIHYNTMRENTNGWLEAIITPPPPTNPEKKTKFELTTKSAEMFSYDALKSGFHSICLINHNENGKSPFKMYMKVEERQLDGSGDNPAPKEMDYVEPYGNIAQDYVPKLTAIHGAVSDMQRTIGKAEARHRQFEATVYSTHRRVVWMTMLSGAVLIVSMVLQTIHLRKFFKEKKLV